MNPAFEIAAYHFEDPFGASADPARYVPREETERALAELEARTIAERRSTLFAGVPGIGKTLMLRILCGRFGADTDVAHLRYPALPAPALFAWALQELEVPGSYDPIGALTAYAARRAARGGEIVLLVDDAQTLPEDSAQALLTASRETAGALRFVATGDRAALGPLAEQLEQSDPVLLVDPMTREQTQLYIRAHLEAVDLATSEAEAFPAEVLTALHRETEGIPARVNAEASRVLRRALGPRFVAPPAHEEKAVTRLQPLSIAPPPELTPPSAPPADVPAPPPAEAPIPPAEAPAAPVAVSAPPAEEPAAPVAIPAPPAEAPSQPVAALAPPTEAPATPVAVTPPAAAPEPNPIAAGPLSRFAPGAPSHDAPNLPPPDESDAALERAAGRLLLAHQAGAEQALGDEALERAAGRLALAELEPVAPTTAPPRRPADATQRQPWRPSRSVAAGLFAACLAAGALIGSQMFEAPAPQPQVVITSPPRAPVEEPAAPAPAPAPEPEPISVQINARPWAEIYIDDELVGLTPLAGIELAPGPHKFEARFPDGTLDTHTLEIDAERRHLTFPIDTSAGAATP